MIINISCSWHSLDLPYFGVVKWILMYVYIYMCVYMYTWIMYAAALSVDIPCKKKSLLYEYVLWDILISLCMGLFQLRMSRFLLSGIILVSTSIVGCSKNKLLYFAWSPPWHARKFNIFWHSIWHLSGIVSDILSGSLSGIIIWHTFWHSIWHSLT